MKIRLIFIRPICFLFLLMFFLMGCKERQATADDFESTLMFDYQRLGYTKLGKDYPSKELLETWKQYNYYSKTYLDVQNAKKELLDKIAADPRRTLAFSLETMCRQCSKDTDKIRKENEVEAVEVQLKCLGSIISLYYFKQDDQDKMIMERLLKTSPQVLKWVAEDRYEWFYNRPNPQRWIDALEKLPDDRLNRDLRETLILRIKDAINNPEKFGVML